LLARRLPRTRTFLFLLFACGLCCAVWITLAMPKASARVACGRELWSLKTLSDPQRGLVNLRPRTTTVGCNQQPAGRRRSFPGSDIHLVLFGQGGYLIAEMPAAVCLPPTTRNRRAIVAARRVFESRCARGD
jgi:hypothetical protein